MMQSVMANFVLPFFSKRLSSGDLGLKFSLNIFYCLIVIAKGSGYKFSQH